MGPLIASSPSSIQENSQNSNSLCGSLNSISGLPSLNPIDIRQFPQNPALWNEAINNSVTTSNTTNSYLQRAPLMVNHILKIFLLKKNKKRKNFSRRFSFFALMS